MLTCAACQCQTLQNLRHPLGLAVARFAVALHKPPSNIYYSCLDAARPGLKPLACRIINTGSMHALVASPYKSAYNAAKHGIAGLTKTVGLELAQKGNITCNAICPGWV